MNTEHDYKNEWANEAPPDNVTAIDFAFLKIAELEGDIEELRDNSAAAQQFWGLKIEKKQKQIEFFADQIHHLQNALEKKTIDTPHGTAKMTSRVKKTWPDNETLLKFSKDNGLTVNEKLTVTPIKKEIADFIKNGGEIPEGYMEEEVTNFTWKTK